MLENKYKDNDSIKNKKNLPTYSVNNRITITLGIIIQILSLFLFIAFVSHILYYKSDQSIIESLSEIDFKTSSTSIKNWLGILGAISSYYLIFRWLGISAFLIIFPLYLIGHRFTYKKSFAKIGVIKNITSSIMLILWISLTMGYLSLILPNNGGSIISFVGGVGFELGFIFKGLFGWGTILIILGFIPIIMIYIFGLDALINFVQKCKFKLKLTDSEEEQIDENIEIEESPKILYTDKDPNFKSTVKPIDPKDFELIINPSSSDKEPKNEKYNNPIISPISSEDLEGYKFPEASLLNDYPQEEISVSKAELEQNKKKIVETLINFNIGVTSIYATIGPTVTLYEIIPDPGVKISRIKNLEDDIALSLAALGIRIIAPIPGRGTIGIEVPNKNKQIVPLKSIIDSDKFRNTTMALPIVMGKGIDNESCIVDLATMPHLLIAGATGQGKSVGLNVVLASLIYKKHPSQLKLVLVDPKKVELSLFSKLENHFLAKLPGTGDPIITETKKVIHTLKSLCAEMDQRYELLKDAGVRNIKEYNVKFNKNSLDKDKNHRFLPYIVLVIDEFADLMMVAGKEIEMPIARLAQLARAIGIHLILATQRPSVNIITGIIKANFPVRVSFKVSSKVDSRTILDTSGAEQLVGRGDFLLSMNSDIIRLQCPFLDTDEVERLCLFVKDQPGYPEPYILPECSIDDDNESFGKEDISLADRDPLFGEAAQLIVMNQQGSTSLIQRRLKLGYNRAGRLMDQLEMAGIVGPADGSKPREVLLHDPASLEVIMRELEGR